MRNEEQPLLAATGESLHAATTEGSKKKKKIHYYKHKMNMLHLDTFKKQNTKKLLSVPLRKARRAPGFR